MDTRRDFLKKAALLAGTAGYNGLIPESIQKALAIDPAPGTTFLDAEHIVILMQENRSFDHAYGSLQGVRGFDDPRAIDLPNGRPVWCQSNAKGLTYAPFRLNIKDSKATWMSALPHSWTDQVDARNNGKYDGWLASKRSGHKEYAEMPLTMGYYNREDIPFYYALADAFTLCDHNFCSSLTGTTPNRLYLWTGTISEKPSPDAKANVRNSDVDYDKEQRWKTFPERLEDEGVSWKIYQNEISLPVGFNGEEDSWLANFTDNPIEWFEQYQVRFSPSFYRFMQQLKATLPEEIATLKKKAATLSAGSAEAAELAKQISEKEQQLTKAEQAIKTWNPERYAQLSAREKALHEKAFTTNRNDPDFHSLTHQVYHDETGEHQIAIPKGDILYQFRKDVQEQQLPTVSWIVAPEKFSDHPGAPWYGAWYLSEVMDILTQNPKVWEKTIFILAYDENDGYFDHLPPFVPPHPERPHTGLASKDIHTLEEFVTPEQERSRGKDGREGPIGLGFRVPLLIASPWSRGGRICSEVFDHTSVLQFLERFLSNKTGKTIQETNISSWRRSICGDLSSVFRPYNGERYPLPKSVDKAAFVESIYQAQFKPVPDNFKPLQESEIAEIRQGKHGARQEKGMRASCALPYELYADGQLSADKKSFELTLKAANQAFGAKATGAPFQVYAPVPYLVNGQVETASNRHYAVSAGDSLRDSWKLEDFKENNAYHLRVYGPNGFFREFKGSAQDPALTVQCTYHQENGGKPSGKLEIHLHNSGTAACQVLVQDRSYHQPDRHKKLGAGQSLVMTFDLKESKRWYDFSVLVDGFSDFEKRFAGRVETGEEGVTDPLIGA
ncbi:MAG: phospholipase C, phosphocholine-specific [Chitinophagales bacterium]|nr:phospholipase C, phosphocholine-specific [Chitinophagales bacterium]